MLRDKCQSVCGASFFEALSSVSKLQVSNGKTSFWKYCKRVNLKVFRSGSLPGKIKPIVVGPAEPPRKGGGVDGTNEAHRALAGVDKLALADFQQHYLLLSLKHLDHFLCLVGLNRSKSASLWGRGT